MQARFAGILVVWCVHVLRCHQAAGWDDFLIPFLNPQYTPSEDCKKCGDTCLDPMLICDGIVNCQDGSDEENCDFIKCREPSYFKCRDKCILAIKVCNKEQDCEGGEDEENCDQKTVTEAACTGSHFRCSTNNVCIPEAWTCDGTDDCGDNSDETLGCEQKKCKDHEFECKSKRCIPLSFRCDGHADCEDRSDEESCENKILDMTECTLHQGKFACKDKYKCIDIHKTCDSNPDCMDGSDEGGLCTSEHSKVCTNCSHQCQVTPEKAICSCPHGFVMNSNMCKDINECEEYGICDQKCLNTEGGYSCACESPYVLQIDERTCKMTSDDAILLYSTSNGLKGVHLQSHVNFSINNAVSFGVTVANSNMYWTSNIQDNVGIYKASLKDYEAREIISSGLGTPEDIDVDWITNNIYFTDSKFKHIGVCESNGVLCAVLHQKIIDKPRSLSLSPETGLLFWTDWGSKPIIGKSGMDGSKAEAFVTKNIHWPNGICTDTPNDRVYWVDGKQHIIESIKFDGTDRRLVSSDYVKSPFSISVFENKLYWSNWDGNEISECDKFTGKNRRSVVRDPSHRILGIHVEHPMRHAKNIENPCNNNPCSDLCLIAPGPKSHLRYSCACPEDKQLSETTKICRVKKNAKFLVAAYKNNVYVTEPRFLGRSMFKKFSLDVESITSMAYDLAGQLIVADCKSTFIKSYNFTTRSSTTLPAVGLHHIPSMQYDDFGNNLYWCDLNALTIEAMSLNTYSRTIIFSGTVGESPIDLALVPNEGYMFVGFVISYSNVQIDRIAMDGSLMSRSRFLEEITGSSLKLYFDVSAKRLFWANSNGEIESVDDKGKDRMFHVKTSDVVSIAYVDGALFWTKKKSPYINWKDNSDKSSHINRIKFDIDEMFDDEGIIIINPNNNLADKSFSSCLKNNGGCSHLCLISDESPKKSICACPIGYALSMNGLTCTVPQSCGSKQFACFTGECISFKKVCDKHKDCLHGEDELLENCLQTCPGDQFLCHDGTKCIDAKLHCDGNFDCNDHSDEVCHTNCTDGKFNCDDGECIESQFRCDGKVDCKNAADERNCHLTTCRINEFRCNSGQCIHHAWYCDGQIDCTDGSDEMANCTNHAIVCGPDEFHCSNDRCVNVSVTCDRHDDCGDNSDEDKECIKNPYIYKQPVWYPVNHQLHVFKQCNSRTEFQCHTKAGKHCIPLAARCDGVVNCLNGEDEQNCSTKKCLHENEFFCKNSGRCIPDDWVCDHHNDCGDNSDEALAACVAKNVTKKTCPGFQCANGECIMMSKVCNDAPDCSDSSDEGGSCGGKCDNFKCTQKCLETPKGPYCSCEHGYILGSDNKTCHDIDECKLDICAQNCTNTPGSFVCSCFSSDYTLKSDRVTCKANGDAAHYVIASLDEMSIVTNNWMRTEHPLKLPSGSMITAMDVDNKNGIVYSVWDYSILVKINFLKMEVKKMFAPLIYGVAADWITENVYYIKDHYKIMVASFSARNSSIVYATKKSVRILSMAVDPVAGYLFWYESYGGDLNGNVGMIKRADCNGENVFNMTEVIQNTVGSMTVDSYDKYLYLYERYESVIARINYDASSAGLVLHIEPRVVGFSFFENSIYWASENSDVYPVRKCKIYGLPPRKCEVIRSKVKDVRYFGLIQENRQRIVANPCNLDTCSDICTTSPTGPKCLLFEGKNSKNQLQVSRKIETASSFSTGFAYFIVICLIVALGFLGYRYYRPKSQFFHRFHFYNTPLNRSERIYSSRGSGINEMVTNKTGNAFLESVTEENIDSEFSSSGHKTSRESLIRSNL